MPSARSSRQEKTHRPSLVVFPGRRRPNGARLASFHHRVGERGEERRSESGHAAPCVKETYFPPDVPVFPDIPQSPVLRLRSPSGTVTRRSGAHADRARERGADGRILAGRCRAARTQTCSNGHEPGAWRGTMRAWVREGSRDRAIERRLGARSAARSTPCSRTLGFRQRIQVDSIPSSFDGLAGRRWMTSRRSCSSMPPTVITTTTSMSSSTRTQRPPCC
jgi:hypothetical protein